MGMRGRIDGSVQRPFLDCVIVWRRGGRDFGQAGNYLDKGEVGERFDAFSCRLVVVACLSWVSCRNPASFHSQLCNHSKKGV